MGILYYLKQYLYRLENHIRHITLLQCYILEADLRKVAQ